MDSRERGDLVRVDHGGFSAHRGLQARIPGTKLCET